MVLPHHNPRRGLISTVSSQPSTSEIPGKELLENVSFHIGILFQRHRIPELPTLSASLRRETDVEGARTAGGTRLAASGKE
jgi:hypothetical protein